MITLGIQIFFFWSGHFEYSIVVIGHQRQEERGIDVLLSIHKFRDGVTWGQKGALAPAGKKKILE